MAEDARGDGADQGEKKASPARRAFFVAVIAAAAVLTWQILTPDDQYFVTGTFENASQLVPGNQVMVGGIPSGTVEEIKLGPKGEALVKFTVDEEYVPLHRGTVATVRSGSLSGVANRQVQLTIPPDSEIGEEIPAGGTLSQAETVSEVDLDELFNTLDPDTVEDFKHVIQGFETSYDGVGPQTNQRLSAT